MSRSLIHESCQADNRQAFDGRRWLGGCVGRRASGNRQMLKLTKLDQRLVAINPMMVVWLEETPDTVLVMVGGQRIIVREKPNEVIEAFIRFHDARRSRARRRATSKSSPRRSLSAALRLVPITETSDATRAHHRRGSRAFLHSRRQLPRRWPRWLDGRRPRRAHRARRNHRRSARAVSDLDVHGRRESRARHVQEAGRRRREARRGDRGLRAARTARRDPGAREGRRDGIRSLPQEGAHDGGRRRRLTVSERHPRGGRSDRKKSTAKTLQKRSKQAAVTHRRSASSEPFSA